MDFCTSEMKEFHHNNIYHCKELYYNRDINLVFAAIEFMQNYGIYYFKPGKEEQLLKVKTM